MARWCCRRLEKYLLFFKLTGTIFSQQMLYFLQHVQRNLRYSDRDIGIEPEDLRRPVAYVGGRPWSLHSQGCTQQISIAWHVRNIWDSRDRIWDKGLKRLKTQKVQATLRVFRVSFASQSLHQAKQTLQAALEVPLSIQDALGTWPSSSGLDGCYQWGPQQDPFCVFSNIIFFACSALLVFCFSLGAGFSFSSRPFKGWESERGSFETSEGSASATLRWQSGGKGGLQRQEWKLQNLLERKWNDLEKPKNTSWFSAGSIFHHLFF